MEFSEYYSKVMIQSVEMMVNDAFLVLPTFMVVFFVFWIIKTYMERNHKYPNNEMSHQFKQSPPGDAKRTINK